MKTIVITDNYQIVNIEEGGNKLGINLGQEGINEQDILILTNHPEFRDLKYEVIKVQELKGILYATLVKIPGDLN